MGGLLALLVALLTTHVIPSGAFNLDTRYPIVHSKVQGTQFGYSIAFYHERGQNNMLIVGAPKANSEVFRRDIKQSGAVYQCQVDARNCREILFDREGNNLRLNGSRTALIDEKSYQFLGFSVATNKKGGSVLACAPHYKYFFSKFEVIEPVGSCWYGSEGFENIQEFAPCRQEPARHGRHRFGYGMCGFSASIPDDGRRLFIGAPGNYYWQGSVFSQNTKNVTDRPNTLDGPAKHDHHMLGYSQTVGDFDGDRFDDVAAGVPRADDLRGMVYVYTQSLDPIVNLTDPNGQAGQYFGHAIAVGDVNNDGLDDIIVGSPMYTDYKSVKDLKTQEHKPQYEVGKVSVFLQKITKGVFEDPIHIVGKVQWGRLGFSVAFAGDLNHDGFGDFVVGAPYDGDSGAVYVFHGAKDGVRLEPTQKIVGKELSGVRSDLKTFGWSLAAGRDVDGNKFPDVAVGAMESSTAVVLRTKPILRVHGTMRTNKQSINLEEKFCHTDLGQMACEKIRYCLRYDGELDRRSDSVDLKVRIRLDSKADSPRAFFLRRDLNTKKGVTVDKKTASRDYPDIIEQQVHMRRGQEHCETHDVYVPDSIRDKINPIHIAVNYSYEPRESRTFPGYFEPALDTTLPQTFTTELVIDKNCGPDNECTPDLQVHAISNKEKFTIGTQDPSLLVNVTVRNRGEDSYLTQLVVDVPKGFEYGGIENYNTKTPISCTSPDGKETAKGRRPKKEERHEGYQMLCDIGNPLPANQQADFGFKMTGTDVDGSLEEVQVKMRVNSTNAEEAGRDVDNEMVVRVPLEIQAQLSLVGRSSPEQLDYNIRNRTSGVESTFDFQVGPVVSHLFQVINRGKSTVNGATLDIFWPSYSDDGRHLLYLIDGPLVNEPKKARCRVKQNYNVNPESLTISNEHLPTPSPPAEPSRNSRNRRRPQEGVEMNGKKNLLKQAVRLAKQAGTAVEYRGELNRGTVDCNSLNCTHIECDIGELRQDEFVLVEVFARLWLNTLIDGEMFEANISSLALAKISALSHGAKYIPPPQIIAVTTDVNPIDPDQYGQRIPWWWILIAIIIGLLILLCLICCLRACGFFKRNRPPTEQAAFEKGPQPM
ncbi:hypothetical protein QR680_012572 [Steinernema hermaphroditum]|uniref:Integrin alpha-2 domain-containing protein n=1 Tax=Steinernema hermaphroditum TaxID=289476 RepID=A0AA39I3S0_9BILA|nr:hypothetical protein QR680_012572 [Steinernema hermaphroditum]